MTLLRSFLILLDCFSGCSGYFGCSGCFWLWVGLDKVAAQAGAPQPQEMREEVKPSANGKHCTGISRIEFLPYPSFECLLETEQTGTAPTSSIGDAAAGLLDGIQSSARQHHSGA